MLRLQQRVKQVKKQRNRGNAGDNEIHGSTPFQSRSQALVKYQQPAKNRIATPT
jgi:hypothetical protein